MKSILIPTDFDLDTVRALRMAADLRKNGDVHVTLLSASHVSNSIHELLFPSQWKSYDPLRRRAMHRSWKEYSDAHQPADITISEHHQYGMSRPILNQLIEHFSIDMVIIPFSIQRSTESIHHSLLSMFHETKTPLMLLPAEENHMTGIYRALYLDKNGVIPASAIDDLPFHVIQQSMVKPDGTEPTKSMIDNLRINLIVIARNAERKMRESTGNYGLPVLTI